MTNIAQQIWKSFFFLDLIRHFFFASLHFSPLTCCHSSSHLPPACIEHSLYCSLWCFRVSSLFKVPFSSFDFCSLNSAFACFFLSRLHFLYICFLVIYCYFAASSSACSCSNAVEDNLFTLDKYNNANQWGLLYPRIMHSIPLFSLSISLIPNFSYHILFHSQLL